MLCCPPQKAQACLDECLRVLKLDAERVPPNIWENIRELEKYGLSQTKRMYELLYRSKSLESNVGRKRSVLFFPQPYLIPIHSFTEQMKTLCERQEIAFKNLTELAVWVQNQAPEWEADLRAAKVAENAARREWAQALKGATNAATNTGALVDI
jgi:hypothetical protein